MAGVARSSAAGWRPDELPPMTYQAVLFDMDGVLVDSFEMWFHAMNEVAVELDCPAISREAIAAVFGQGIDEDLRTFFRGVARETLTAAYQRAVTRNVHRMEVNPGARAALDDLARRGVGRAIVTNTQASAVPAVLAACGLADHFEAVIGVVAELREKPAPDMLFAACAALGVAPDDALMVGDSGYDAGAAHAAGIAYLHYEMRSGTDLVGALADR